MNDHVQISVIMPVYNGAEYLREAIQSILGQSFKDFEFLILDDGSIDDSLEIALSFRDRRIKIFKNKQNIGIIKTLNKGIAEAKGKYIARMDADDISLSDRFALQKVYLDENPEAALVGGQFSYINSKGELFAHQKVPTDNEVLQRQLLKKNCFAHPSVMMRSDVVREMKGYSEEALYVDDYDLWLRIAESYKLANIDEVVLLYRVHEKQTSITKIKLQVDKARKCRIDAIRRRNIPCDIRETNLKSLTVMDQLRGVEGSYGEAYYNWSKLYNEMGALDEVKKIELRAFLNSPLSVKIAKSFILGRLKK